VKGKLNNTNRIVQNKFVLLGFFCVFLVLILRLTYLALATKVDGVSLVNFASNRNTTKQTLYATRGTIYDSNGNYLAQTVDSYTLLAYLDESRSENSKKLYHVADKENTAKQLATVIDMSEEDILKLLNKDLYQVEFGRAGKGLSELEKEAIEKLELPGIDFIQTKKRYYPNGNFASYIIGYTVTKEDDSINGEMGIELYCNERLSGTNGYTQYEKDAKGYKLPNSIEIKKDKEDGNDVYLTIDSNIQLFVENAINEFDDKASPEWSLITVMDAKTGKILASSSTPSFNPNKRDMTNYLNPLVSYAFEPGSTMKIFTYMSAIEKGTYDGDALYESGTKKYEEDTISDWKKSGWGTITYDRGFTLSSNLAIANLLETAIDKKDLMNYFKLLRFGEKTGIELPKELKGKIAFKYAVEVANAGFGQGITVTPVQLLQAATSIANDGVILKPYIIDKIVDIDTGEVIIQNERTEVAKVASTSTVNRIKELMYGVVNGSSEDSTGYFYKVNGYDLIGKTGTAQFVNPNTGRYYSGSRDYIYSFLGMFPKDDPEVIVYIAAKRSTSNYAMADAVKDVVVNTAKYLDIKNKQQDATANTLYVVENYLNKSVSDVKKYLDDNSVKVLVIGDGDKIVSQYPNVGVSISENSKLFLNTNASTIKMPNLKGLSRNDASAVLNLIGVNYSLSGSGYVTNQSVSPGEVIDFEKVGEVIITLEQKYSSLNMHTFEED